MDDPSYYRITVKQSSLVRLTLALVLLLVLYGAIVYSPYVAQWSFSGANIVIIALPLTAVCSLLLIKMFIGVRSNQTEVIALNEAGELVFMTTDSTTEQFTVQPGNRVLYLCVIMRIKSKLNAKTQSYSIFYDQVSRQNWSRLRRICLRHNHVA